MDLFDKTSKWWAEAKERYSHDELARILIDNTDKLKEMFHTIDGRKRLYRAVNWSFSRFYQIAKTADSVAERFMKALFRPFTRLPGFRSTVTTVRSWKSHLNLAGAAEFIRAKIYSLIKAPHNEKAILLFEEIMEFASRHGLDINQHLPRAREVLTEKKNQLLQHKFFQEFTRTRLEQVLAIPFSFDRCLHPVLPDSSSWHKLYEFLERRFVRDIILVDDTGARVSLKNSGSGTVQSTGVIRILKSLSAIKAVGERIFFVGHHEGYLGPYFVRSVVRKLGFDNLTGNCNTVVGPRMFSNVVLRSGAANVGNLFITVPSEKTTAIRTDGLAGELKKIARKTQCLIKFPRAGISLIKTLSYEEFQAFLKKGGTTEPQPVTDGLDPGHRDEVTEYLDINNFREAMMDLKKKDYDLFREITDESFLIFPEGSRSYADPDGSVVLKYINPRFLQAYMRPGDYIAPISLVGGSDMTRGWRLRPAVLGVSLGEPFEVTSRMLENYEHEGLAVMRKVAALPNIKKVHLKDEIQFRRI